MRILNRNIVINTGQHRLQGCMTQSVCNLELPVAEVVKVPP